MHVFHLSCRLCPAFCVLLIFVVAAVVVVIAVCIVCLCVLHCLALPFSMFDCSYWRRRERGGGGVVKKGVGVARGGGRDRVVCVLSCVCLAP